MLNQPTPPLFLAPTQDIRSSRGLAQQLAACLSDGKPVVIDAAPLEAGDISLIQILIATWKSAQFLGVDMTILHPPPALMSLLERCGLDPAACLPFAPQTEEARNAQDNPVR